jgi:hypothetical protein
MGLSWPIPFTDWRMISIFLCTLLVAILRTALYDLSPPSTHPPTHPPIHPPPSMHACVCTCGRLSINICRLTHLSYCLSVCLSVCLPVCLSVFHCGLPVHQLHRRRGRHAPIRSRRTTFNHRPKTALGAAHQSPVAHIRSCQWQSSGGCRNC